MRLEDFMAKALRQGDQCLDVGGHIGNIAALMAVLTGPSGKVVSFEADPNRFRDLQSRATHFANLVAVPAAVSDSESPVTLYFGTDAASDQAATIVKDNATADRFALGARSVEVPATTLDSYCAHHGVAPDFIKIDVEGAEPMVFAGAARTIEACMPMLVFEMGDGEYRKGHLETLRRAGYSLFLLDIERHFREGGTIRRLSSEGKALQDTIFTFSEEDLVAFSPMLANVLAVDAARHKNRLAEFLTMPCRDAGNLLVDPDQMAGGWLKRAGRSLIPSFVPQRFPGLYARLRRIANGMTQ